MRIVLVVAVVVAACGTKDSAAPAATGSAAHGSGSAAADPMSVQTWIPQLKEPRKAERALQMIEQLGDPAAIQSLAEAWIDLGMPVRIVDVVVALARPLTPEEAKREFFVDYETNGRPASWDKALPFLTRVIADVDSGNERSIESATKAAEALGEASLPAGLEALLGAVAKASTPKLMSLQVAAIRALGKFTADGKDRATAGLIAVLSREPPNRPSLTKDPAMAHEADRVYTMFLQTTGAAINALGELREPRSAKPLVIAMYRFPELMMMSRRALVAIGPAAQAILVAALRGDDPDINTLFMTQHLGKYCGDAGDYAPPDCKPVSAKDFYPAVVLGDFHDAAIVPDLLAALKRPAMPQYYLDDQPSGTTQHTALFDALRKIGAPTAAAAVREIWMKGKPDDPDTTLAVAAYPFVTRDATGSDKLAALALGSAGDDQLRMEAATALARISRDAKDIATFGKLAKRQLDASAKLAAQAAAAKQAAEAADQAFAARRAELEAAKAKDPDGAATKKLEAAFKTAKQKHKDAVEPFKRADDAARTFVSYARLFQSHIARLEIALRCADDGACYAASLALKPDEEAANVAKYIPDAASWSDDQKHDLVVAAIERAMLELGKRDASASQFTDALLDAAVTDDPQVRESILLALPHIAKLPCAQCATKLDAAIKAGEGKTVLAGANIETTMLRNYFASAKRVAK